MLRIESKGKGTFRRTKSGSLEYRISYYDDNNVRRIKSFNAQTEEECMKRASEFLRIHELNLIKIDEESTISEIMQKKAYNDYLKNYTGEQGYDRNLHIISIIERSSIGSIPIGKITEKQLMWFLEEITSYSNTIIRKVFAMVSTAFKLAYERNIVSVNYIVRNNIKCPKSSKANREVRGLTEDEQKTIDSKLEQHPDIEFTKIVGRTYQVYYSDQMTYLVGDEEAAIKAIEKLQKQQEKTK